MVDKYQPNNFEEKWVKVWEEEKIYSTQKRQQIKRKDKQYVLAMFPYPSGAGLHVGHVRIYTGTDVLARFLRMKGLPVLHPMGWDAFGLPAENAAIKERKNPMDLVPKNIANFKRQMKRLGFSYDWNKEFATTDPAYYRWTQWLFIQFFKMGLLEKKALPVYYCPSCKTGLAEEEVLPDGTHERCQQSITRKVLPQWVFKITKYADRLLYDLDGLDWPSGILEMQKNWIGRSEGTEIKFKVKSQKLKIEKDSIKVFTTRVDTLFGVTALVLAPEHWLIQEILNQKSTIEKQRLEEIKKYVEEAKRKLDLTRTDLTKEKTGVDTGIKAIHPLTGEEIPVWVADYVVGWYGEGAVMVVPGHDQRDYQFAVKFNLPIKIVVLPDKNSKFKIHNSKLLIKIKNEWREGAFEEDGILVNSGEFDGLTSQEAIAKITQKLQSLNLGKKTVQYKLRDWIFSRQRYWGEPIPMVYCRFCADNKVSYWQTDEGKKFIEINNQLFKNLKLEIDDLTQNLSGWFPLPEDELPLTLPYIKSYLPTTTGESPLSQLPKFVRTKCPHCQGEAKRETDTMPNWAGSCWYFIRFAQNQNSQFKNQKLKEEWHNSLKGQNWLPVDWYLGGAEHAVLHLLYSRFWVKALYDLGLVDFKEPFLRLRHVGMVLAEDHRKMSKSFGNVINPDEVVDEYGADSLRLYEMFMAPFSFEIAWSTKALQGCYRFLKRVWERYQKFKIKNQKSTIKNQELIIEEDKELVVKLNKTIKKVTDDIKKIKFNTAVAAMMEFVNDWEKKNQNAKLKTEVLSKDNAKKFLQILAPFAPFLTEEIWREIFGEKTSIHLSLWPETEKIKEETVIIPVQVNGKLRGVIKTEKSKIKNQNDIEGLALQEEKVRKYLEGKRYRVIYVVGKVLNFVVE